MNRPPSDLRKQAETENVGVSPYVTSRGRSRNMAAIRRRDTRPERELRAALHRIGYRFRKDYRVDLEGVRARPDIAFTKRRVAVFVDGCFWHACPEHFASPRQNSTYWSPKIRGNVERDRRQDAALSEAGWVVLRIWEHEATDDAVERVRELLARVDGGDRSSP